MANAVARVRLTDTAAKNRPFDALLPIFREFLEQRPTSETLHISNYRTNHNGHKECQAWQATRMIRDWYHRSLQRAERAGHQKNKASTILFLGLWELVFVIAREIPYCNDKPIVDKERDPEENLRNNNKREILAMILDGFFGLGVKEFKGLPSIDFAALRVYRGKSRNTQKLLVY